MKDESPWAAASGSRRQTCASTCSSRCSTGSASTGSLYGQLFGVDPLDEHADIWRALVEREWVVVEPGRIALVGDGVFYTPLIQGLLAVGRLDEMRRARLGRRTSRSAELAMALEVTE